MSDNFDQFIVKQTPNTQSATKTNMYYTAVGNQDYIDDEGNTRHDEEKQNTFAKIENGKFFIKVGLDNRAYNPIGLFSEGQHNKVLSKIGKNEFNYKKVNQRVFELYLSFLRTKNIAWLNNTNRELS